MARSFGLKIPAGIPQVVGHLTMFWLWSVDNAPDGDLSTIETQDIADAAGWTKSADVFMQVLIDCGFVDENMHIHDWDDYIGKLIMSRDAQKNNNKIRQQRYRDNKKSKIVTREDDNTFVTRYDGVTSRVMRNTRNDIHNGATNTTIPNRTQHTQPTTTAIAVEGDDGCGNGGVFADVIRDPEEERASHSAALDDIGAAWRRIKGVVTDHDSNKASLLLIDYPAGWILEAIEIAGNGGEQTWRYVEGILRNFKENGRSDGDDGAHLDVKIGEEDYTF